MTPEMRAGIEALIAEWRQKLSLGNWDIRLSDDPPSPDSRAETRIWPHKFSALVHVQPDAPEPVWPELVVHELLHIVLSPLKDGPIENHLGEYLSPVAKRLADAAIKDAEEPIIHQLTVAFTGHGVQCWRENDPIWADTFPVVAP